MRRRFQTLTVVALMLFWVLPGFGQKSWPFPEGLNGTMMPYDFSLTDSIVPWEEDMRPVFINYIARHGARYLSSEKKVDKLRKELAKAKQEGNISQSGYHFLNLIQRIETATDGNWGALNEVGIKEEQILGRQMYEIAPGLLKDGKVEARATYVPRVVMTMYELCHELTRQTSDIEITTMEGRQFNPLLRYFKVDSVYMDYIVAGPWQSVYDEFEKTTTPCSPAATLFVNPPDDDKLRKLTLDMYDVLQSLQASDMTAPVEEWFTQKEYEACWKVDNLKHYYQRSASKFSDIPSQSAKPLLQDIIDSTDAAISGKSDLSASLRFGHAETVIPLFALMRLPGCYAPDCSSEEVASQWKDYDIAPLGANLLMVVLVDSEGIPYVAMRLNGKWIDFGQRKTIEWNKLKSQWLSSMRE